MTIHIDPDLPKKHDIRCTACSHVHAARVQSPHRCELCFSAAVVWMSPPKVKITLPKGYQKVGPAAMPWCMTA